MYWSNKVLLVLCGGPVLIVRTVVLIDVVVSI